MDFLITAAARALALGDPLSALNRVALRDDAAALALRGIAMAQLGNLERARVLVRRAARAFGTREAVARARCQLAEAEIALVTRDLCWPPGKLDSARLCLEAHGDRANAAFAAHLQIRRLLLLGHLDAAERALQVFDPGPLPAAPRAVHELAVAAIGMRRIRTEPAQTALQRALDAAGRAGVAALVAQVEAAREALAAPAARILVDGATQHLTLAEVEAVLASDALVVDACRHAVRHAGTAVSLTSRPVLFELLRLLAEYWPTAAPRDVLVARVFRARVADESQRARLRVEMGRLRALLQPLAGVRATRTGFRIEPRNTGGVVVLAQPFDEEHGALLALLADGESWSSAALALALGASQRTVQRALRALLDAGRVHAAGRGRAQRWMTPPPVGITTTLLLPGPFPNG